MPLFRGSAAHLLERVRADTLVEMLNQQFRHQIGHRPSPAEQRSWRESLTVLANDLHDAGLPGVEVLLEYQLPLTSKRVDALLCGTSPRTGEPVYLTVELKQWSQATMLADSEDICVLRDQTERLHPVEQVRAYCRYLNDFVAGVGPHLHGAAYLHNAQDDGVRQLFDLAPDQHGRLFTGQRRGEWLDHLRSLLSGAGATKAADQLLSARVRPSKQLLGLAAEEVQRREQFVLLDEQRQAYSLVMRAVERAQRLNTKEVLVVTGGPGSGKSVIALSLLGELARQGYAALHATGSSAFTKTLRKVAGARAPPVKSLFKG